MLIEDFINKHLGTYKKHGREYILTYCPFCGGGTHNDKNTFSINEDKKTFFCQRGKCGAKGHYNELLIQHGEPPVIDENYKGSLKKEPPGPKFKGNLKNDKKYKLPQVETHELKADALEYAALRKITPETLAAFGVSQKENLFVFNFKDPQGKTVFIKYRPIGKVTDDRKKSWREKNTMPILFNMNNVDINKPIVITEGEFDAMAVHEAGYKNVVSVPSGCKDFDWIENCWDWLQQASEFIIYGDNDAAGAEMIEQLIKKLGPERTKVAEHEYKDANEELYKDKENNKILENINRAIRTTPAGIIRVSDIKERQEVETIPTGIEGIDRILEDCQPGELTVWTGKNGSGKSTILGQVVLSAINSGTAVFCYSGELTKERFKSWVDLQAAGEGNVEEYINKYGDTRYKVKAAAAEKINAWYADKLFLYDNSLLNPDNEESDILEKCKLAAQKFNCKLFVIDNLMTADFKVKGNNDYYRAQSDFVGRLTKFAKTFDVHIHLVAHPKKTNGPLDKDAIQGTGDITNRADNVIALERPEEEEKEFKGFDYDAIIRILKNRNTGETGRLYLKYSIPEKSYFQVDKNGSIKKPDPYNWAAVDPGMYEVFTEDCPF